MTLSVCYTNDGETARADRICREFKFVVAQEPRKRSFERHHREFTPAALVAPASEWYPRVAAPNHTPHHVTGFGSKWVGGARAFCLTQHTTAPHSTALHGTPQQVHRHTGTQWYRLWPAFALAVQRSGSNSSGSPSQNVLVRCAAPGETATMWPLGMTKSL